METSSETSLSLYICNWPFYPFHAEINSYIHLRFVKLALTQFYSSSVDLYEMGDFECNSFKIYVCYFVRNFAFD